MEQEPNFESKNQYIKIEDFDGLDAVEIVPYTGPGKTSYAEGKAGESYDIPKMEYLTNLGIQIPDDWLASEGGIKKECRALFISTFIVTGNILVTEGIRRTLGSEDMEMFSEIVKERNTQIEDARLDKYGYRRQLRDGTRVEDHFERMGLSANPEKRVSPEELRWVTGYVLSQLKSSKE